MDPIPYTAIKLDTEGECPHCGRPVLGLADGRCSACEGWLESYWEMWPSIQDGLHDVAKGWNWERLTEWAKPRPGQLAWALQTRTWKALEHWVHEQLWRPWAHLDARRRDHRVALQVEQVDVNRILLAGIAEDRDWVRLRVHGHRVGYVYRTIDGRACEGSTDVMPFEELWTLRPTGRSADSAELRCPSCAAAIAFEDMLCPYCGVPVQRPLGPWLLEELQLVAIPGQTSWNPFSGHLTATYAASPDEE